MTMAAPVQLDLSLHLQHVLGGIDLRPVVVVADVEDLDRCHLARELLEWGLEIDWPRAPDDEPLLAGDGGRSALGQSGLPFQQCGRGAGMDDERPPTESIGTTAPLRGWYMFALLVMLVCRGASLDGSGPSGCRRAPSCSSRTLAHRPALGPALQTVHGTSPAFKPPWSLRDTLAAGGSCMLAPGRCHDEGHRDQHRRARGILLGGSARADAQSSPARGARGRRVPDGGGVPIDDVADPREPRHRRPPRAARRGRQPHPEPPDGAGGGPDRRSDPRRVGPPARAHDLRSRARGRSQDCGGRLARHAQRDVARLEPSVLQGPARVRVPDRAPTSGPSSARSAFPWTARGNGRSSRSGS